MLIALLSACGPEPAVKVEPKIDSADHIGAAPAAAPAAAPTAAPSMVDLAAFPELLKAGGLVYEAPPGYRVVDVPKNERWAHVHALKSTSLEVEIRFGAAPKAVDERLAAACKGAPPCAAVPLKVDVEEMLKVAVLGIAAATGETKIQEFPLDAVRDEFNAHWGGVVGFDVDPAFANYKHGVAVVIHREGRDSAMFVALFDGLGEAVEDERMRAFHALRFAEPFAARESEALAAALVGTRWFCDEEFVNLRFEPSTFGVTVMSVAMLAMGRRQPHERAYYEITYLPGQKFSARAFRVDNWERGDRTSEYTDEERYSYRRKGDTLTLKREGWKDAWKCTLRAAR